MLRNANNEWDLSLNGFFNRFPALRCRDEDGGSIGFKLLFGSLQVWEQWESEVFTLFAGSYAANDIRSICQRVFGIAGCHSAGEALVYHARVLPDPQVLDCVIVGMPDRSGREDSFGAS